MIAGWPKITGNNAKLKTLLGSHLTWTCWCHFVRILNFWARTQASFSKREISEKRALDSRSPFSQHPHAVPQPTTGNINKCSRVGGKALCPYKVARSGKNITLSEADDHSTSVRKSLPVPSGMNLENIPQDRQYFGESQNAIASRKPLPMNFLA